MAQTTPDISARAIDEHEEALLDHVRPSAWENPAPTGRYDLLVIGAGPAGLITASGAAGLGARVALVEKHRMGGDCLNVGCVPSKALIACARAAAGVRRAHEFGVVGAEDARVDFPAVMRRMRKLRAGLARHDSALRYREMGIDVFLGAGTFVDRQTFQIGDRSLHFRKACIATGARAAELPIPGLKEAGYLTNETVFSLTELPRRLAVIGAGPIGCELAQAFARFGSEVMLIEAMPQILIREDRDAAQIVQRALERDGVKIVVGCKISNVGCRMTVEGRPEGKTIVAEHGGARQEIAVDQILVGVGRAPNVEGLGLEAAGVEFDRTGIKVDDRLRTTNRSIFAAGDISSPYKFTHVADAEARIVIANALFRGRGRRSALTVPWCTYTDPELAHVGLYAKDAEERGIKVDTFTVEMSTNDRAILDGEVDGFLKVHVRKGTDRIVGATLVAARAGDMISELTLAMTSGAGLKGLSGTIHPYPTQSAVCGRAGDAYSRTRLTPLARRALRFLLWLGR